MSVTCKMRRWTGVSAREDLPAKDGAERSTKSERFAMAKVEDEQMRR